MSVTLDKVLYFIFVICRCASQIQILSKSQILTVSFSSDHIISK